MDKLKRGGSSVAKGGRGATSQAPGGAGRGTASLAVRGGVSKRGRGKGAAEEDVDPASSFKGSIAKDLKLMMYGFGDHEYPSDDTVDLVEDIVVEYIKESTLRAAASAADALKPRVDEKDVLFSVRKEPAKFARVKELLIMREVIRDARNSFKEVLAEEEEAAEEAD